MSLTVPITKQDVLVQLLALGISTPAQVAKFVTEPRQYEANNGPNDMQTVMHNLGVADNLQWQSRKRIRHYAKQLLAEGALS